MSLTLYGRLAFLNVDAFGRGVVHGVALMNDSQTNARSNVSTEHRLSK
jgi:hypothetical protein